MESIINHGITALLRTCAVLVSCHCLISFYLYIKLGASFYPLRCRGRPLIHASDSDPSARVYLSNRPIRCATCFLHRLCFQCAAVWEKLSHSQATLPATARKGLAVGSEWRILSLINGTVGPCIALCVSPADGGLVVRADGAGTCVSL